MLVKILYLFSDQSTHIVFKDNSSLIIHPDQCKLI